jgi:predicted metal-binding membrane protein
MQWPVLSRAMPATLGVVVLIAGASQFTAWKAHHLSRCRSEPEPTCPLPPNVGTAWQHGLRLAFHCICSSAGSTAVLLVVGVMDLRAMAVVAIATTAERLVPSGDRVAHAIGIMALAAGTFAVARATGAM